MNFFSLALKHFHEMLKENPEKLACLTQADCDPLSEVVSVYATRNVFPSKVINIS